MTFDKNQFAGLYNEEDDLRWKKRVAKARKEGKTAASNTTPMEDSRILDIKQQVNIGAAIMSVADLCPDWEVSYFPN
jgi:hypothetical protein